MIVKMAKAIDPKAWERRAANLLRRDEWETAIKVSWPELTFEQWCDRSVFDSIDAARKVLAELRRPTEDMFDAVRQMLEEQNAYMDCSISDVWDTMIATALAEKVG